MKLSKHTILAGLLVMVTSAGLVIAAPGPQGMGAGNGQQRGPMPFESYDQNADGMVTAEEFAAVRAQRMADREQRRNEKRVARFNAMDTDKDGMLSQQEFVEKARQGRHKDGCKGRRGYGSR